MTTEFIIHGFASYEIVDQMMHWLIINVGPETNSRKLSYLVDETVVFTSNALYFEHSDPSIYRDINNYYNKLLFKEDLDALEYGWRISKIYEGEGWCREEHAATTSMLDPIFTLFTIEDDSHAIAFKMIHSEYIFKSKLIS
jgi:hypothetical protein